MALDTDVARVAAALRAPGLRYRSFGNESVRPLPVRQAAPEALAPDMGVSSGMTMVAGATAPGVAPPAVPLPTALAMLEAAMRKLEDVPATIAPPAAAMAPLAAPAPVVPTMPVVIPPQLLMTAGLAAAVPGRPVPAAAPRVSAGFSLLDTLGTAPVLVGPVPEPLGVAPAMPPVVPPVFVAPLFAAASAVHEAPAPEAPVVEAAPPIAPPILAAAPVVHQPVVPQPVVQQPVFPPLTAEAPDAEPPAAPQPARVSGADAPGALPAAAVADSLSSVLTRLGRAATAESRSPEPTPPASVR